MLLCCHHILFRSNVGDFVMDLRLRDVVDVSVSRSVLIFDNGLVVTRKGSDEKVYFGEHETP
jgi:hypothetical protein